MFLKRLVAFIVLFIVIFNLCVINIYADEDQSYLDWLKQACTNVGDLIDGNITTDEFLSRSSELVVNPQNVPSMALNTYTQIQDSIRSLSSDMLPQDFYNFLGKISSPLFETHREYVKKPSHDLKGYGALYVRRGRLVCPDGGYDYTYYYCDYIQLHVSEAEGPGAPYLGAMCYRCHYSEIWCSGRNEYVHSSSESGNIYVAPALSSTTTSPFICLGLYGDVRESDGSSSDVGQDDYIDVPVYNFDNDSSADLSELLNKLLEALKIQQPDFSSLEGILQAIYYQCTGINSKMITYDQCNSLIMSLIASGNSNTQEIVNALLDLREDLKDNQGGSGGKDDGDDTGDSEDDPSSGKEIAGTLYNVKPLDKNFFQSLVTGDQNLRVEYEGKIYYLESDGTLLLDDKYYYVDMNYEGIYDVDLDFNNENVSFDFSELTASQERKLDKVVETVSNYTMQYVPYASISSIIPIVQAVIFNTSKPDDIVISIDGNGYIPSFQATFLSVSFLHNEYVQKALLIVKPFLTLLVGYAWLLAIRRKAVSMVGG